VATDAGITRTAFRVMRMRHWINRHRALTCRLHATWRRMTLQTELIVRRRQNRAVGMRIMTIQTRHARVPHPTQQHRSPIKIFVPLLTIWVKNIWLDRQRYAVVVVIIITRLKIIGQRLAARVTGRSSLHHFLTITVKRRGGLSITRPLPAMSS